MKLLLLTCFVIITERACGYAFVANKNHRMLHSALRPPFSTQSSVSHYDRTLHPRARLSMVDDQILLGAGVAIAGLAAGIGLVAFTEAQGERAKQRGGGLSERMATNLAGGLLEDVEVSSVDDLGSLTSQLEKALKESGGAKGEDLGVSEEAKKRIAEEADDGW